MRLFVPYRRATLLMPSGPANDPERKHLFIVLTDPVIVTGYPVRHSLLVGISTVQTGMPHDPACLLHAGDHPFIRHRSYVNYRFAKILASQSLVNGVRTGVLVPKELLDGAIFARVCRGLLDSRFSAPRIVGFYNAARAATGG